MLGDQLCDAPPIDQSAVRASELAVAVRAGREALGARDGRDRRWTRGRWRGTSRYRQNAVGEVAGRRGDLGVVDRPGGVAHQDGVGEASPKRRCLCASARDPAPTSHGQELAVWPPGNATCKVTAPVPVAVQPPLDMARLSPDRARRGSLAGSSSASGGHDRWESRQPRAP
jgi:hypothetical protein